MADKVKDLTNCIELQSGNFLNFIHPDVDAITREDVAHGLAHVCRYTGQCDRFYSVAEHACLVTWRLRELGHSVDVQWAGLHHDDAEAFVGDVNRPLKQLLPEYATIERRIWGVVDVALKLGIGDPPTEKYTVVKDADNWALSAEAYHMLPSRGGSWFTDGLYDPDRDEFPADIGFSPAEAKESWLLWYNLLAKEMVDAD